MQTSAPKAPDNALAALKRLWTIANGNSGQCKIVAAFLLGLYNGNRFPFDLTDFRCLDTAIVSDCFVVLALDYRNTMEVHCWLCVPGREFEQLARDWRIKDRSRRAAA